MFPVSWLISLEINCVRYLGESPCSKQVQASHAQLWVLTVVSRRKITDIGIKYRTHKLTVILIQPNAMLVYRELFPRHFLY